MKAQIKQIRRIERNADGDTINLIVIDMTNGKSIVRKLNQFIIDLENSGRLINVNKDSIVSVRQGSIVKATTKLIGGFVEGEFGYHKAGDKYEILEGHPALTNKDHKLYGQVVVGDKVAYEQDGTHVDAGEFLLLIPSIRQTQIEEIAEQKANLDAELEGLFNYSSTSENTVQEFEELPEDLVEEAVGEVVTETAKPKAKETVETK